MLFYLFKNLEQLLLSLLFMSKAEVIRGFSQSGFYALKRVFNNTAFQQWCQHHLTAPFLSFRKHPSCVCQEFDTGRAWVRKTHGCSLIWNMGDAWEQRSSWFHCYCGDTMLGVWSPIWLPCWSNMVWSPVAFWYLACILSTTVVTLPSLEEELTLLSRAPGSSGSDISSVSSLCVIWSCWIFNQALFYFRYARYAIKSDFF